jgi:hypothetical protein
MQQRLNSIAAELKLASNGDGARTAKVQIVARSGDPCFHPAFGPIVHDFAGMSHKPRIPLDYAHNLFDSIGYVNKFDTADGDLVCTGAVVLFPSDGAYPDPVAQLVAKMQAGVPYEASIETGDEMALEYLPEGFAASVNGRDVSGPVTIVRQWELKGVAICKFGVDSDTSTTLKMSEQQANDSAAGPFRFRISRQITKGDTMPQSNSGAAVETPVAAPATPAAAPVAEVTRQQAQQLSEQKATEVKPAVDVAAGKVDATAPVTNPAAAAPVAPAAPTVMSQTPAVEPGQATPTDPRAEARRFIDTFGAEAGAKYFAQGIAFDAALAAHVKSQGEQIAELNRRIAAGVPAVERGAAAPVTFTDAEPAGNGDAARVTHFSRTLGPNLAKFAASIKLPEGKPASKQANK